MGNLAKVGINCFVLAKNVKMAHVLQLNNLQLKSQVLSNKFQQMKVQEQKSRWETNVTRQIKCIALLAPSAKIRWA